MTEDVSPRSIYLAVESETMNLDQINDTLNTHPDRGFTRGDASAESVTGRPPNRTEWRIIESGAATTDMSMLAEALHKRISPIKHNLRQLKDGGCEITLRIVFYHSPGDEGGEGFVLESPLIASLADIGASLDVDQYIFYPE